MPISPVTRLSILTFPQAWDGTSLTVRFLCLPKGNPLTDPFKPGLPAFASANLVFEPKLIGSLDRLPLPADAAPADPLLLDEPPTQKAELFGELTKLFNIVPRGLPRPQAQFRKVMTESYRSLIGDRRRSTLLADSAEFHCALHQGAVDQPAEPVAPTDEVTWGRLIAFALRQPKLASALGLMGQATVTPGDPSFFANGGWLYIDLHPTSDYAGEIERTALYAARIPKLTVARPVFAAVLFPVLAAPADFVADDVAHEAQLYDDGVARLVHCAQGDGAGDSIQLAWEDEQIAEWLHRQVQVTPGGELKLDAPNGVAGYRVDVRKAGAEEWNSLVRMESQGDLQLGDFSLGSFQGEGIIEVAPAQVSPKQPGMFWLPSYFASWRGSSLALTDLDLKNLHARPEVQNADSAVHMLNREKVFVPVDDKVVPLEYGQRYEFRVRFADLTRGGPDASVGLPDPAGHSVAGLTFQRRKSPGPIEIVERPRPDSRQVKIARPTLGYPEALFTGKAVFGDLERDLEVLAADPTAAREIGVPDPDVLTVEIRVEVKSLRGDGLPYLPLYQTTRAFDRPELTIILDFQKHATLATLDGEQPAEGPLALPTARELRLTFSAIGTDQANYFVDEKARHGAPVTLDVRAPEIDEPELLSDPATFPSLRSFFFQPPPPGNTVSPPAERLAAEIGLDHTALTLSGRAGSRTVIACSDQLHHTLTPESSAITFASGADLVQRWINVLQFTVARDWTWDGLDASGIKVTRVVHFPMGPDSVETAGVIRLPRVIGPRLAAGAPADARAAIRQSTNLLFFDAFDPKPAPPLKPSELTVDYLLEPAFEGLPPVMALGRSILLPVTTPPSQTPRIVSAGIALSDYKAADDYSSTAPRRRMLWFEFDEAPADPGDAYFVRLLAKGPDPMMLLPRDLIDEDAPEPPLPIDPEWMRMIAPGQSPDANGLSAMQQLQDSPTEKFYLVPLPPGLSESSAELFGFFVYEVRLGHTAGRWSTAQGRFGPALRVAGVQHPPPPLVCQAGRDKRGILVQAPYATPVSNGVNLRPFIPQTDLWALLYARVRQADGAAWRNVLLARKQLFGLHVGNDPERLGVVANYGEGIFDEDTVAQSLSRLGLRADEPLTVLAAELFADPRESDPLGNRLGHARTLRISPLVPVPNAC
jgi:hypothetical protein